MSASSGSPHLYRSAKRVSPSETLSPLHRNDSALAMVGTVAIMTAQQTRSNALTAYWRVRPLTIRFGWMRTTEGSDGATKVSIGWIFNSLLQRGSSQPRNTAQGRLGGVETKAKVFVRIRRVKVGRLVVVGIPSSPDVHATFVLTQAD